MLCSYLNLSFHKLKRHRHKICWLASVFGISDKPQTLWTMKKEVSAETNERKSNTTKWHSADACLLCLNCLWFPFLLYFAFCDSLISDWSEFVDCCWLSKICVWTFPNVWSNIEERLRKNFGYIRPGGRRFIILLLIADFGMNRHWCWWMLAKICVYSCWNWPGVTRLYTLLVCYMPHLTSGVTCNKHLN